MLFGVVPDPDYPVCELAVRTGDRLLLYTDGLTEPENSRGESFGPISIGFTFGRPCFFPSGSSGSQQDHSPEVPSGKSTGPADLSCQMD